MEKKCKKCGTKIGLFNKSFKKDICNKCFSKPVNDFFKGAFGIIILIIFIIFLFSPGGDSNNSNSIKEKLDPLEASVTPIRGSFTTYQVLNINSYPWHNVKITVNEEYSCWSREVLEPGEKIIIQAATCNDFAVYNNAIYFIEIKADEGWAKYASQ